MAFDTLPQIIGRQIDGHAQFFENIGAAAARRDSAIAMFHYDRATSGQEKHDRGRNVEKIETVPACATNINHRSGKLFRFQARIDRAIDELSDKSGDLLRAFALLMQRREKLRLEVIGGSRREQNGHTVADVFGREVDSRAQLFYERFHAVRS